MAAAADGGDDCTVPWEEYLRSLAAFGMRPGLARVEELLDRLDHPEREFRAIHVVGTNGKSSTTRYCAAILTAHGLRAGAYLSPHISGFTERALVDGQPVGAEVFGAAVTRVRAAAALVPPELGPVTQFEALTVAAFAAFAECGVEAAAVEAGLGGRLDATNVLRAPVVVLTNVELDHTDVLGTTREAILAEKVAVVHGGELVCGRLDGLGSAAEEAAARAGARSRLLGRDVHVSGTPEDFRVSVDGWEVEHCAVATRAAYQLENVALAVAACRLLLGTLHGDAVRAAVAGTVVPGRLQVIAERPLTLADGAHNPDGVRALVASLDPLHLSEPRVLVLSVLADKDVATMVELLASRFATVVCTQSSEPRALSASALAAAVHRSAPAAEVCCESEPATALAAGRRLAGSSGTVLVSGSLYLLADLSGELSGRSPTVY